MCMSMCVSVYVRVYLFVYVCVRGYGANYESILNDLMLNTCLIVLMLCLVALKKTMPIQSEILITMYMWETY